MYVESNQANQIKNRIIILKAVLAFSAFVLFVQCMWLQVFQYHYYNDMSQSNYLKTKKLPAIRGLIVDRNLQTLAENKLSYAVNVTPNNQTEFESILNTKLKTKLTTLNHEEVIKLKSNVDNSDKFEILMLNERHYPFNQYTFPVVGYGTNINNQFTAINGIEKFYDTLLSGKPGSEQLSVSAFGHSELTDKRIHPRNGDLIALTIDINLQKVAYDALEATKGSVIALNPKTGEILALVSKPSLDPNTITKLYQDDSPLLKLNEPEFNRVTSGQISPGSTIKPFLALTSLEDKIITPKTFIHDYGFIKIANHVFHDWKKSGHGDHVDILQAITESCDTFYYKLAQWMGIQLISNTYQEFGFGQLTSIDLPNEQSGLVPSPQWKRSRLKQGWYLGDTIITAIGQGALLTTPIQLANATAVIANEGYFMTPHLLKYTVDSNHHTHTRKYLPNQIRNIKPEHYALVKKAMQKVMIDPNGTGYYTFGKRPYSVAGKTGTTQITSHHHKQSTNEDIPRHLANHSLFIGFAPVKNPQIVVVTIVENSEMNAARVARKFLDFYFKYVAKNDEIIF